MATLAAFAESKARYSAATQKTMAKLGCYFLVAEITFPSPGDVAKPGKGAWDSRLVQEKDPSGSLWPENIDLSWYDEAESQRISVTATREFHHKGETVHGALYLVHSPLCEKLLFKLWKAQAQVVVNYFRNAAKRILPRASETAVAMTGYAIKAGKILQT